MSYIANKRIGAAAAIAALLLVQVLFEQYSIEPPAPAPAGPAKLLSGQQLDNLVAPIALYPDPLLGQVLAASTYPFEVAEAQQWVQDHPKWKSSKLMKEAKKQNWDPSIQGLVAFPQVLTRLYQGVNWTTSLGNAVLAQQADVMQAVQRMRAQAQAAGKLPSTSQETVATENQVGQGAISIEPANPNIWYVPYYNPAYVWGPPIYGYYPPLLYPGIDFGFGWGAGIDLGLYFGGWGGWGWGGWGWSPDWYGDSIILNHSFFHRYGFNHFHGDPLGNSAWAHDPVHRLGVPYANREVASRFAGRDGRGEDGFDSRGGFNRGPAAGRGGFGSSSFEQRSYADTHSVRRLSRWRYHPHTKRPRFFELAGIWRWRVPWRRVWWWRLPRRRRETVMTNGVLTTYVALVFTLAPPAFAQQHFDSADAAAQALIDSGGKDDSVSLATIFGPQGNAVLTSGDAARDRAEQAEFSQLASTKHRLITDPRNSNRVILAVGDADWPFPVPIVRSKGDWSFDASETQIEMQARRIGADELDAIEICAGYVKAQRKYASEEHDKDAVLQYASHMTGAVDPRDALAPLVPKGLADATSDGQKNALTPYHGYFFRILDNQGPHAPGGAHSYRLNNKLMGGFGLVAWPAQYGVTGVLTLVVNQDGEIYQKDIAPLPGGKRVPVTRYDPDPTWKPVN